MTDAASTNAPPPRRYLAAWFPFLPTDRLRPPAARHELLVLVEKTKGAMRIVSACRAAHAAGLAPGLSLADARARFPYVAALPVDTVADATLLDRLATHAERFTPTVALDPPHGLMLDITGCAHLFGGEAAMRTRLRARMRRLGLSVRATIAGTPDAARALARFGRTGVVPPGMDATLVRPLLVAALGLDAATLQALARAGLRSIGDLADRPSVAFAARFGEALPRALRRTLGHEDARIVSLRPATACIVERQFAEPLTHADAIEAVLADLVADAAQCLRERGQGGRMFEASFFRSDGAVRRVAVETGRPSRDIPAILRLFRERLDALADPLDPGYGFDAVRLGVPCADPLAPSQPDLDGHRAEDIAVAELIDRLVARLGRDRVLAFAPRNTHDPARATRCVHAAAAPAKSAPWPAPEPGAPPTRPLHLFARPQPIETLAQVPDGPPRRFRWRRMLHEIARAEGPERIAPEWWRTPPGTPTRDYYRVEDRAGHRFWLFREGLYGEGQSPRWYMHGLFA